MGMDESTPADADAAEPGPPPTAVRLGQVFTAPIVPRIVVRAPLQAARDLPPGSTGRAAAEEPPDPPPTTPTVAPPVRPPTPPTVAPPVRPPAALAPPPVVDEVVAVSEAAFAALVAATEPSEPSRLSQTRPVAAGDGTRFCPLCGMRVPVDVDGQRCHVGHRLSPAHVARHRHWWRRG